MLKALFKQFFGAKYERIGKSLAACMILFFAVRAAEIRMEIASFILFLTATALPAGIMWQTLHSSGNADRMAGMFMLPFSEKIMTFSLVSAFACYTLLTKTFPVLALFFAVHEWSVLESATALVCACNGCFTAAAWYTMTGKGSCHKEGPRPMRKMGLYLVVIWGAGMLSAIFLVQEIVGFTLIVSASLLLSIVRLWMTDAYVFYRPESAKPLIRRIKGSGSIFAYLLRYLMTNPNYLLNTAGLCVLGGVLPMLLGQFEGVDVMPLGFAILCLNTPVCILLSCDPDLERAVRVLPGQAGRFCIRYGLFIFIVNMTVSGVYLISWQICCAGVGGMEIMTAALIALQSAVLSVLLEWFYPIRNWKIESDIWNHPRKYAVPVGMLLLAGLIGVWPAGVWVLFGVVLLEILNLLFLIRRG